MRYLVIARHGQNDNELLTIKGVDQVQRLGKALSLLTNGGRVLILHSPALRATQSAQILSQTLDSAACEKDYILSSYAPSPGTLTSLLNWVRGMRDETDILVLVTHLELCAEFPPCYAKEELGIALRDSILSYGQAIVIDCQKKRIRVLP
jgi:phosphohistidine phosphatase SixA